MARSYYVHDISNLEKYGFRKESDLVWEHTSVDLRVWGFSRFRVFGHCFLKSTMPVIKQMLDDGILIEKPDDKSIPLRDVLSEVNYKCLWDLLKSTKYRNTLMLLYLGDKFDTDEVIPNEKDLIHYLHVEYKPVENTRNI